MRTPLPTRRLTRGMPCMLLAALMLFARMIAPAAAMPAGPAIDQLALLTLCHGSPADDHAPGPPAQHDCLLCPACHLLAHAAIPLHDVPPLRAPAAIPLGLDPKLPQTTGPPQRPRAVAQPTGPPALPI